MLVTISDAEKHFAAGAESVTLTAREWRAILDIVETYTRNGYEVGVAKAEIARITRIARPLWKAASIVAQSIRACGGSPTLYDLRTWEQRSRHSLTVDWHDLPMEQRTKARASRFR